MRAMTKKLILLITSLLLVVLVLSACGLSAFESGDVSDAARQKFIEGLLNEDGVEILYAPLIVDEEGEPLYDEDPAGYTKVSKSKGSTTGLSDMYRVLQNDNYELYIDFKTTDIAVLDLETGFSYHSNPDRDPDTSLSASQQITIASPLSVEAYDSSGKRYSFNFYENCFEDGSFYVLKTGDDSIRLIYTIGNDPDKDLFPPVITKDTYDNVIMKGLEDKYFDGAISEDQYLKYLDILEDCYRYVTPNPEDKSQALSAEDKERFAQTFPHIDVMSMYISYDKVSIKQKGRVKTLMETIGFTAQDVKREMEKADYQGPERAVLYTIPVDLVLNENGLSVNLDSSLILGPTKQRLNTINLYRGMGATKATYPNGYMIVPDGSGALIPVKGNLTTDIFKGRVYGADGSFNKQYDTDYSEQILAPYLILDRGELPANSNHYNAGGIIAIMEEGAGLASVIARPIQGNTYPVSSINYEVVYSERDYRTYSTSLTTVGGGSEQSGSGLLLSKDDVTGVYRIQYLFTEGGISYPEYATYLRNYFTSKELFPEEKLSETELPFFVDLIGCVDMNETVAGVPVKTKTPLTTYKQSLEILTKLKDSGISNVVARYTYWANGGENNVVAKDLELLDCMGTKGELTSLVQYCNDNGMGFFPSVEFLSVTSTGNGFNKSQDAARRMNRSTATIVERMNAIGSLRTDLTEKILVSSKVAAEMSKTYKASFEKILENHNSIALGNLGKELHSNHKTNNGVSRAWAEKDHVKILQAFEGYDIAVSTGNFYTWNYASHIFGLSTGSSEYQMATSSIPFTQIMLHGYVNYSMDPLNQTGDYENALLLALETGSAFTFRWMGAEDSIFDYTEFYNYFSLKYTSTFDRAVEIYKEAASVLNDVVNEPITDHMAVDAFYALDHEGLIGWTEIPVPEDAEPGTLPTYEPALKRVACDGVFATVYGGKKVVLVNYNSDDMELNDRTVIKAKSYLVLTMNEYNKAITGTAYQEKPTPVPPVTDNVDDAKQEG